MEYCAKRLQRRKWKGENKPCHYLCVVSKTGLLLSFFDTVQVFILQWLSISISLLVFTKHLNFAVSLIHRDQTWARCAIACSSPVTAAQTQCLLLPGNEIRYKLLHDTSRLFISHANICLWCFKRNMAGNKTMDLVHQNAIHTETILKEQRHQILHTEFSINPHRKCEYDFQSVLLSVQIYELCVLTGQTLMSKVLIEGILSHQKLLCLCNTADN